MTRATPDHSCLLAALMTPRGRGAVATIAIRGEPARHGGELASLFRAANGRTVPEQPFGRIVFGQWGRDSAEDVVLCRIDAQTLEIHCHGGETAAQRILEDWRALGAEIISWEAMIRATSDVLEAEFQVCLSRATTWQTTESLLRQAEGRLRQAFEALRTAEWSVAGRQAIQRRIRDLLRWSEFGLHLSRPWKVVLTGRPNVGKSSLINALLGYERSIVFNQPGTTRDVVTALTAFDGWPVELSDTAGLRPDAENLEAAGIELAQQQLAAADLVVVVEDGPGSGERESVTREVSSRFRRAPLLVANKDDIPGVWQNKFPEGAIRVSAKTGTGLNDLQQAIVRELVPQIPAEGVAVPVTERQIELLRRAQFASEQGDEVGYHAAVSALLEC